MLFPPPLNMLVNPASVFQTTMGLPPSVPFPYAPGWGPPYPGAQVNRNDGATNPQVGATPVGPLGGTTPDIGHEAVHWMRHAVEQMPNLQDRTPFLNMNDACRMWLRRLMMRGASPRQQEDPTWLGDMAREGFSRLA